MRTILKTLTLLTILTVMSCASDDTASITINQYGNGDNTSSNSVNLSGNYTENLTLDANTEYILNGALIMEAGSTLTIPAGTLIKANSNSTNVFIAIKQGAKIMAEGTSTQPIVITSNSTNPAPGDWGGILLLGNATINSGETATSEVANLPYGGTDDADNSGIIRYMRLEYTGAKINSESEFNGFSFYGVGSGTIVEYVQAHFGNDDGLEFFGGTVSASNVVVTNAGDDSIDWTEGWRGTLTHTYVVQNENSDKAIEADGNEDNNSATPLSNPTIVNFTTKGLGSAEGKEAIRLRRGTQATFTNTYIQGYAEGFDIDNALTIDHVFAGTLSATDVNFDDVILKLKADEATDGSTPTEADFISGNGNGTMTDVATWGAGWTTGI